MSMEFWAIIGVGVALAGLIWRLDARIARVESGLSDVRERLARIEGQVELLLRGLHIEIKGGGES